MRLLLIAGTLTVAVLASACSGGFGTDEAASYLSECAWTRTIWISRDDTLTQQTEDQIIAHNETRAELCDE